MQTSRSGGVLYKIAVCAASLPITIGDQCLLPGPPNHSASEKGVTATCVMKAANSSCSFS